MVSEIAYCGGTSVNSFFAIFSGDEPHSGQGI